MLVSRVMTSDPIATTPLTSLEGAARLMRDHNIGSLPVVKDGKLVGIITDRDLIVRALADGRDQFLSRVGDLMTTNVHCCSPEDRMEDAVAVMARYQVRRVPVCAEDGSLLGMVALGDISFRDEEFAGFALSEISEEARILPVAAG